MHVERHAVDIVTATGGGATQYTPGALTGQIASLQYVPGATGVAFASTVDFTVTVESTGEVVWQEENVTAAKTVRPRRRSATASGATASDAPYTEGLYVANDRLKIVVAQGGNTKRGRFNVLVI